MSVILRNQNLRVNYFSERNRQKVIKSFEGGWDGLVSPSHFFFFFNSIFPGVGNKVFVYVFM